MAHGKVMLDTYSDLITAFAGKQSVHSAKKYLSIMLSDPECFVYKGEVSTQIHNLKLYIDGTLCTEHSTKALYRFNDEQLAELEKQIDARILHDAQLYQQTGMVPKATRTKNQTWTEMRAEELLMGSSHMSQKEAKKSLIHAINDERVLVIKDEYSTRPATNIGALHLCADGELYHIDDIITMYNFSEYDMQNINMAIEQRIVRDAELVAMAKRMKVTKVQSTQPANAPMTIFQKAQNWLTSIKQQFRTK